MLDFVSMLTAYEEAAATEAKAKQQQAIVSIDIGIVEQLFRAIDADASGCIDEVRETTSLLATRYSLLATRYSLLATRYSLLTTHHLLLTTYYSPLTTHLSNHHLPLRASSSRSLSARVSSTAWRPPPWSPSSAPRLAPNPNPNPSPNPDPDPNPNPNPKLGYPLPLQGNP
eukprot:scaffold34455_cov36-Phaeocystis_antarctica.AAC.1